MLGGRQAGPCQVLLGTEDLAMNLKKTKAGNGSWGPRGPQVLVSQGSGMVEMLAE